jgi:hypothetical protein
VLEEPPFFTASRKAKTQPARTRDGRSWQGEHECPALGSKISHRASHLREADCVVEAAGFEPLHFGIRSLSIAKKYTNRGEAPVERAGQSLIETTRFRMR